MDNYINALNHLQEILSNDKVKNFIALDIISCALHGTYKDKENYLNHCNDALNEWGNPERMLKVLEAFSDSRMY